MPQIPYNSSSTILRFEYPPEWNAQSITGVTLTVNDVDGNELLAAAAATIYTATTLSSAAAVGESTVTLTAMSLVPGDRVQIAASASGKSEDLDIKFANTSTKVATLERELRSAHASGTAIKGQFCTYDLDTSTVATFPKSEQLLLIWTPAGSDDLLRTQRAEIAVSMFSASDFNNRFRVLYPNEYEVVIDVIDDFRNEAITYLTIELQNKGLLLNRVQDQDIVMPCLLACARYLVTNAGGDQWTTENDKALQEYIRLKDSLCDNAIWVDSDQDQIRDEDEIDDYSNEQLLGSERSL